MMPLLMVEALPPPDDGGGGGGGYDDGCRTVRRGAGVARDGVADAWAVPSVMLTEGRDIQCSGIELTNEVVPTSHQL